MTDFCVILSSFVILITNSLFRDRSSTSCLDEQRRSLLCNRSFAHARNRLPVGKERADEQRQDEKIREEEGNLAEEILELVQSHMIMS